MEKRVHLSDNHKRSLSSTLQVVEKSLVEMRDIMLDRNEYYSYETLEDVGGDVINNNLKVIDLARLHIRNLTEKYNTTKEKNSLHRIINAKRSKMWEILKDSMSRRLKGYGTFPKKHVEEYDSDIEKLIEIINQISY